MTLFLLFLVVFLSGAEDVVNEEGRASQGIDDTEAPPDEGKSDAGHHDQMPSQVPHVHLDKRED